MAEQASKRTTGTRKRGNRNERDAKPGRRSAAAEERAGDEDVERGQEVDEADEENGSSEQDGGERTLASELKSIVRGAALEVLGPVAKEATTAAAKYALRKGPEVAKDTVAPMVEEAGGPGALAKGIASKAGGAGGGLMSKLRPGGEAGGTGKGRRLPVQEHVDVAVPLEAAYNQFTQFEDFPQFMHRVEKVEQRDEAHLVWHENIWGVRREWEAEITEQRPNERIAWKSLGGTQTTGVVTFHRLSDRLTRVEVNLDFQPQGLFEKTASGFRMSRRALRSDLMRFKAFVEMREEETGAWRGQIEEGEVVEEHGDDDERELRGEEAEEEPEAEEESEAEAEEEPEEEEPVAHEPAAEPDEEEEEEEEEEPEAQEPEDEPEEGEKPKRQTSRRRRQVRRRAPAGGRR